MSFVRIPTSFRSRIALALLFAGGGTAIAATRIISQLRRCRAEQQSLTALSLGVDAAKESAKQTSDRQRATRVAVDRQFIHRLIAIFKVCVTS